MTRASRAFVGTASIVSAATLWGLWPVWVRWGGAGGATATIALLVTGVLGVPIALAEGRGRKRPAVRWLLLGGLGVTDAGNAGCYFLALAHGATAPAVLSHYLAPVIVALLAPRVLREPRSPRTPVALALSLSGTALIVLGGKASPSAGNVPLAVLLGGASAFFYAANVLVSRILTPSFGNNELLSYHAFVSAAILLPFTGLPTTAHAWLWPAIGGALSAFVAGLLFYAGLRRLPTERASILCYVEPFAAVMAGGLVLHEPVTVLCVLGGLLVLSGGVILQLARDPGPGARSG